MIERLFATREGIKSQDFHDNVLYMLGIFVYWQYFYNFNFIMSSQIQEKREVVVTAAETISGLWNHTSDIQEKVQQWVSGILELTPELKNEYGLHFNDYATNVISPVSADLLQLIADIDFEGDIKVKSLRKFDNRTSRAQKMFYIVGSRAMNATWDVNEIMTRWELFGERAWLYIWSGKWSFRNLELIWFNSWRSIGQSENQVDWRMAEDIPIEELIQIVNRTFHPKKNRYNGKWMYNSLISTLWYEITKKYNLCWNIATSAEACAAWNRAFGRAFHDVQNRKIDFALAWWVESAVCWSALWTFWKIGALSKPRLVGEKWDEKLQIYDPRIASRPFDKDRNGFVLGEWASALTLESLEDAIKRNAKILCKVLWHGVSADPSGITKPHPDWIYSALAMRRALEEGWLKPEDIKVIILHGTSTPEWDLAELAAVKEVFGDNMPYLISAKWWPGHKLWDSGTDAIVQAAYMLKWNRIPPTANLRNLENKAIEIIWKEHIHKFVMWEGLEDMKLDSIMINSFAFGWACASTIVWRYRA